MSYTRAVPTVMIVEDSDDTRLLLRKLLQMSGCQVIEARDGQEAVSMVERGCPDMILMDLNLPLMDGLAATERIRQCKELCQEVPIIAITAHHTYGIDEAARAAGCNEYLTKPFDFTRLAQVLRHYLGVSPLLREKMDK